MSSKVTLEKTKKIAELAMIEMSDSDIEIMCNELNGILKYIDKISSIQTDGIEPLFHTNDKDVIQMYEDFSESYDKKDVLLNAPRAKYDHFVVPKVINPQ